MKFSVVIPLYNKEHSIQNTIRSVLRQRRDDFEIIVVNDGATDRSLEQVLAMDDDRIRIIDQENGGVSSARNRGIKESTGEYISFLDADDIWYEDYLEKIDQLTQKYPESDIYVTAYKIKMSDRKSRLSKLLIPETGCLESYWTTLSYPYDFVWTSATTIKKSALIDAGLFREGERVGQDLDMWARVAKRNPKVAYTSSVCVEYCRYAEHNARTRNKVAHARAFISDLEEELNAPERTPEEYRAILFKYDLKKTAHIYTLILNGEKAEARKVLKEWTGKRTLRRCLLTVGLYGAMICPQSVLSLVYRFRLKVF